MATRWSFDIETLVIIGAAMSLLLLYCFIGRFGLARKIDDKHSDSDDDY
jgi:hypothetical protein